MNHNRPAHRPSILRLQGSDRPKKRASWSADVTHPRRSSGLSVSHSEDVSSDSQKSKDYDENYFLKSLRRIKGSKSSLSDASESSAPRKVFITEERAKRIRAVLNTTVWKALHFFFSFILLFGVMIRDVCPSGADVYFDVIFIVTLAYFSTVMILNVLVVPSYFVFNPSLKLRKGSEDHGYWCFVFQIGSFMFWSDFIGVMSLFYATSYTNPRLLEIPQTHIYVDEFGIPSNIHITHPLNNNFYLLVNIFLRSFILARLLCVDNIARLQCILSTLNKAISCKNKKKVRQRNVSHNDQIMMEMDAAARTIQRAWRNSQSVIGMFLAAGAKHRAKTEGGNTKRHLEDLEKIGKEDMERKKNDFKRIRALLERNVSNATSSETGSCSSVGMRKRKQKNHNEESRIGNSMNEITIRRVAVGVMIAIFLTFLLTYVEKSDKDGLTVVSLHNSMVLLQNVTSTTASLSDYGRNLTAIARLSSTPSLCFYEFIGENTNYSDHYCEETYLQGIRNREKFQVTVCTMRDLYGEKCAGPISSSLFAIKNLERRALVMVLFEIFIVLVGVAGVLCFAGPVTTLVVTPIERMIRLLSMLVRDPLGYTKTKKYRAFMNEDNELVQDTMWTQESLNGMETSFLLSTLLRIGSLMKVGFGSAGVDIIRSNLGQSSKKSISMGDPRRFTSTVACIFMFCDIRGFTDSSECLKEEVFVFTNRIAAVVHSFCHAYGGSANKNIGDAFLLSWQLDAPSSRYEGDFIAKKKQADKALLAVVKICIALYHESFFLEGLSDSSISALKKKFAKRPGNLVQLGFGLHAGKAVEGAIGSQRKLDATYLSEAVELSEYLESSTKKYGVNILMSGKFYSLLQKIVKEKCRKIDHIFFTEEYEEDDPTCDEINNDYHMSLHTFDMDIDSLFKKRPTETNVLHGSFHDTHIQQRKGSFNSFSSNDRNRSFGGLGGSLLRRRRMSSLRQHLDHRSTEVEGLQIIREGLATGDMPKRKLEIPETTLIYTASIWHFEELRTIRKRFTSTFFDKFKSGYHAYISGDWKEAETIFQFMVEKYDDKPSQYFLDKMKESNGVPPRNFSWRYHAVAMEYH